MIVSRFALLTLLLALASCRDYHGLYEPSCIAFEGDRVFLDDDRFEWQKFTDQRNVDGSGNVIETFPNYPKSGPYSIDDDRIQFQPADGSQIGDHFLISDEDSFYLLTEEQHQEFLVDNVFASCALKLSVAKQ